MTFESVHSLLRRQLKRCFGEEALIPPQWEEFIRAVDTAYREFDVDRGMLERSLELSSQELIQANSEMRGVFQAMPDLLFRLDDQGTILSLKAGSARDLICQPGDLFGKQIQDIPFKDVGCHFQEAVCHVREHRTPVSFEYSLNVQGQETTYEARLAPMPDDQIIAIIRNITARKQAERAQAAAYRISEAAQAQASLDDLYRSIHNIVGELIPTAARNFYIALYDSVSDTVRFPYWVDEVDPRPEPRKSGKGFTEYVLRTGKTLLRPPALRDQLTDNGEVLPIGTPSTCWIGVPLRTPSGRPIGVMATYHYLEHYRYGQGEQEILEFVGNEVAMAIERKRLEEQFRQSQKMEAFGQLAAGIAHDFNNILTVIVGNLGLLQVGRLSPQEQATATQQAYQAADRAGNLTRQLLTFSRRQAMQPVHLDLNEVVANMTKMLQRLIGEHIVLEARYKPGIAAVRADPGMMEQVLVNLAVNSRDAMPKGGRLCVQTESVCLSKTEIAGRPGATPGDYIRLSVSDTGLGIAPEHMPHIFEPFFTTKEPGKGTGLGLATVFGIIDQHGGWIEVESRVGSGSTFHAYLPALPPSAAAESAQRPPPPAPGGSETILIVEDEAPVRFLFRSMLEKHGYRVFEAASGVSALECWRECGSSIDLVITDMVMPDGLSGSELAERLRLDKPTLKIIFCSGYSDQIPSADLSLDKNIGYLEKPLHPHRLLQKVRDCLDAR